MYKTIFNPSSFYFMFFFLYFFFLFCWYQCLDDSIKKLPETCPTQKAAFGWYDDYMFSYSNQTILGINQDLPTMMLSNIQKVTDNVNEFNQVLGGLLHRFKMKLHLVILSLSLQQKVLIVEILRRFMGWCSILLICLIKTVLIVWGLYK